MTNDELSAHLEIAQVLAAYVHGVDRLDMKVIAGCYAPGAHEDRGRFRGPVDKFLPWLESTLRALESTWHLIGTPRIELAGAVARVETYCLAHHRTRGTMDAPAVDRLIPLRYLDRFACRDGRWAIADRVAIYEAAMTLPVLDAVAP